MKSRGNQTCARWLQSNRSQTESSCYGLEGHDFDFVGDGDGDGDGDSDGDGDGDGVVCSLFTLVMVDRSQNRKIIFSSLY